MNKVVDSDGLLEAEISLHAPTINAREARIQSFNNTRNMSIAVCLFLSWKLFMYARETLFVASDSKPGRLISGTT